MKISPAAAHILEHLKTHRMWTENMAPNGLNKSAIHTALRKLRGDGPGNGYIVSRPLKGRKVYYQLTTFGAKRLGLPEERARPLGPQGIVRAFAIAHFCSGLGRNIRLLTPEGFTRLFSSTESRTLNFNDYFIDREEGAYRVHRILIDHGGEPTRFMRKVLAIGRKIADSPYGLSLINSDALGFTIITTTPSKMAALKAAWENICPSLSCSFVVQPELLAVLPCFYE
jgi:hypothetical protein